MAGIHPYIKLLDEGADVIIGGRSSDCAIFAAPAIRKGFPEGLAYFTGKVLECASFCAEPYAGKSDSGMHFPLLAGTEVALAYVNGDPDRPIILGALPNPLTPNVVTSSNSTRNRISFGETLPDPPRIMLMSPSRSTTATAPIATGTA